MKLTFLGLHVEMIVKESLEDPADVLLMLFQWPRENEDIVKIYKYKLIKHVPENVVYRGLEHSGVIGEPERHYQILLFACGSVEGRLPFVPLSDPHEMVSVA